MNKQLFKPIIIIIIALGIFGIVMNFQDALRNIITGAVVILVVYFLYKFFTRSNNSSNERNAYNRAVKQSKKKYAPQKREPSKAVKTQKNSPVDLLQRKTSGNTVAKKKRKQNHSHLTVIEGKKGKKKDNASY